MQLPDWFMNYGNGRDSFGNPSPVQLPQPPVAPPPVPLGMPSAFGAPNASGATGMGNQPVNPAGTFQLPPMPTPRPPGSALLAFHGATAPAGSLAGAPMPVPRPTDPAGADGTPMQLSGAALAGPSSYSPNHDPTSIGPGSWMPDFSRIGNIIDKNSVIGKLMAMHNPSPGPGVQQPTPGLLPQLYRGLFG